MIVATKKKRELEILALSGGVGGAKLVKGLSHVLGGSCLSVVVNTGDDFDFHGLCVCPDLDTVMYALAGLQDETRGWGIAGETWDALDMMGRYGEDTWFQLGDRDLATHIVRTALLRKGLSLSEATERLSRGLGVSACLFPMSDDVVSTWVDTPEGELPFQDYFVRRRAEPEVLGCRLEGIEEASPSPGFVESLDRAEVVVIAPSNPVVSIAPILALPGIRDGLRSSKAVKIAISPIVAGRALKGPAVEMLLAVGVRPTSSGVAEQYSDFLDVFLLDQQDSESAASIQEMGMATIITDTVMRTEEDKIRLAREIMEFVGV